MRLSISTSLTYEISNGNSLILFFPPDGGAVLIPMHASRPVKTPSSFRKEFPVRIEAVPVLGPVEHDEVLVERRTVQRGLATHRASRHFRNYRKYDQQRIVAAIEAQLLYEPDVPTQQRKYMRPNQLARWELHAGQYRIFYDVMLEDTVVSILAVGYKDGNRLYIRGKEYTL